jgi:AcrR family transcriptional regulator
MESRPLRRSKYEPVQARGRKTRRQVLEAAQKVFVRRGFEGARVEEITRLARVGYGTFYKYYRDKQDVFDALMEEIFGQLNDGIFPERLETRGLETQISQSISRYLQSCHKNRKVLLALHSASLGSPRICKFRAGLRDRGVKWLVRELDRISSEGEPIHGNLEVFSRAMLLAIEGIAQDWITHRRHLKMKVVAETLCEIWMRMLCNGRPSGSSPSN